MKLDLQSILNNLLATQSDKLMIQHLKDEKILQVWNSFMICRFLSFSQLCIPLLPALNTVSELQDPFIAYPLLLGLCKNAKDLEPTRAGAYMQSPFN